jgi:hypothetical protein
VHLMVGRWGGMKLGLVGLGEEGLEVSNFTVRICC